MTYQTNWASDSVTLPDGTPVNLAGRVVNYRNIGSIAFGKLVDHSGKIQFCLNKKETPETFKEWSKQIKLGNIISISGIMWTSSTGERTVLINEKFTLLKESLHSFPDKFHGIADVETRLRKRYLDIVTSEESKSIFRTRSTIISTIRSFLESEYRFMEVETPILQTKASGAQAKPFQTRHNAYNADLYLRIAPETYLKRTLAASFDRVYEIGKNFRNEGIDTSHLQEFTSIEWYVAYWNYRDNLELFRKLIPILFSASGKSLELEYQGATLDFNNPAVASFEEVFQKYVGYSWEELGSAKEIDTVFKERVRPKLIQPIFLIDYPAHMSPLAHRSADGKTVEQWQFIVNGWELVKCYTELTDPVLQRKLLEAQMSERSSGDDEAMMLEEDFLECMEYGIPPCSGLGMGIDRLVALLTNQTTLRDVILFPTVF